MYCDLWRADIKGKQLYELDFLCGGVYLHKGWFYVSLCFIYVSLSKNDVEVE